MIFGMGFKSRCMYAASNYWHNCHHIVMVFIWLPHIQPEMKGLVGKGCTILAEIEHCQNNSKFCMQVCLFFAGFSFDFEI